MYTLFNNFVYLTIFIFYSQSILAQNFCHLDSLKTLSILIEDDLALDHSNISHGIYTGGNLLLSGEIRLDGHGLFCPNDSSRATLLCAKDIIFEDTISSLCIEKSSSIKIQNLDDFKYSKSDTLRIFSHKSNPQNKILLENQVDSIFASVEDLVNKEDLFSYYREYSLGLWQCPANGLVVIDGSTADLNTTDSDKTTFTFDQVALDAIDTFSIRGNHEDKIVINLDLRFSNKYTFDPYVELIGLNLQNITWNILTNQGIDWNLSGDHGGTIISPYSHLEINQKATLLYKIVAKSASLINVNLTGNSKIDDPVACINCPVNFISLGGHRQLCKGSVVEICPEIIAGIPPYNYLWNDGSTSKCLALQLSDHSFIRLEVKDALGCVSTDEIFIEMLEVADARAGLDVEICGVQAVTLTASGGDVYTWSTGERAQSITVTPQESTMYKVTVENNNGCSGSDSTYVKVAKMAKVSGMVYDDTNFDTMLSGQEKGIGGVNVELLTTGNTRVASAVTDSLGYYSIELCPGNYLVDVDLPSGYSDAGMSNYRNGILELQDGELVEEFNIGLRSAGAVVPLEWIDFNLIYNDHSNLITLNWVTAHEFNVDRFELYHSISGVQWSLIDGLEGLNKITNYYVYHHPRTEGQVHYYKIKQIDYNGEYSWSSTKKIEISQLKEVEIRFYPNPTRDLLHLEYSRPVAMKVDIYTRMGQKVEAQLVNDQISLKHLPNGNYIISFRNEETHSVSVDNFTKM